MAEFLVEAFFLTINRAGSVLFFFLPIIFNFAAQLYFEVYFK